MWVYNAGKMRYNEVRNMKKTISLQDITLELAKQFEAHGASDFFSKSEDLQPNMTLTEAYLSLDPLLRRLHKEQLNAAAQYDKLVKELGADDPMTMVSEDMAESALSAFETRLIELKSDKALRRKVKYMICPETQEEAIRRAKRQKMRRIANDMNRLRHEMVEKLRKKGEDQFMFIMFMMHLFREGLQQAHMNLSLAHSFERAVKSPSPDLIYAGSARSGSSG